MNQRNAVSSIGEIRSLAVLAVSLTLLAGCSRDLPVSPTVPARLLPVEASAAATATSSTTGVVFLPPVGPSATPGISSPNDKSALNYLAVEICEWTSSGCAQPIVTQLTAAQGGLRLSKSGEVYEAQWAVTGAGVRVSTNYRIRILAGGRELGFATMLVVAFERLRSPLPSGQVQIGTVLPIRFIVPTGVGTPVDAKGATVTLAGGAVQLAIPSGALAGATYLTALPAAPSQLPANGPATVPGTAWEFGPDGTQFASPVTMTIAYDPTKLLPGMKESELRIHKLVNGAWVQQNAGVVDMVNHLVSAQVSSFSIYVILPRLPGSQQDVTGPQLLSVDARDPTTGVITNAVTLNLGQSDDTLTTRLFITDDFSGVNYIYLYYLSPSGRQWRYPCRPVSIPVPPDSGSDTNGRWDCVSVWPRYSESGAWRAYGVVMYDKVGNLSQYFDISGQWSGSACVYPGGTPCVALPAISVTSGTSDITPPVAASLEVSLYTTPRTYGATVSVDVANSGRNVVFGLQASDDLSGLAQGEPYSIGNPWLYLYVTGPSGQSVGTTCWLAQGTTTNGLFECTIWIPQLAESGTWSARQITLIDRTGNMSSYTRNSSGQLCAGTSCISAPTVSVTSTGDGNAPLLQSIALTAGPSDVTSSLDITDDISGTSYAYVRYKSLTTSQYQYCYASRTAGTNLSGTWSCTVTFSQYAARGTWVLDYVYLWDAAGNTRVYLLKQGTTDTLCYNDPNGTPVCKSFGPLDLILQ